MTTGDHARSNREPTPVFGWNSIVDLRPQKLVVVTQGTVSTPAACTAVQPAGNAEPDAPSKFSAYSVDDTGVPVSRVNGSTVETPCAVVTVSASSIFVPGTKAAANCRTSGVVLGTVASDPMFA